MIAAAGGPLHYRFGREDAFDHRLLGLAKRGWGSRPRTANDLPLSILDPGPIVHEMRLRKSEAELAWMRHAIDIAAEAHVAAMRATRPQAGEHEIEALIEYTFRRRGADGWAYPSIVAGGANATILHYTANSDRLRDRELLLIDAGAEAGGYCADITRTFPVGREPTPAQRRVHRIVLESQLAAIAAVRPGVTFESVHERALEVLAEGLRSLGVLETPTAQIVKDALYRPYYMHRTSHWLGMDVHDVGAYRQDGGSRVLEPGMVLTVEPGLYFAPTLDVRDELKGIGVRIEDDVLVTREGHEVLSHAAPKSLEEIAAVRERPACAGPRPRSSPSPLRSRAGRTTRGRRRPGRSGSPDGTPSSPRTASSAAGASRAPPWTRSTRSGAASRSRSTSRAWTPGTPSATPTSGAPTSSTSPAIRRRAPSSSGSAPSRATASRPT